MCSDDFDATASVASTVSSFSTAAAPAAIPAVNIQQGGGGMECHQLPSDIVSHCKFNSLQIRQISNFLIPENVPDYRSYYQSAMTSAPELVTQAVRK